MEKTQRWTKGDRVKMIVDGRVWLGTVTDASAAHAGYLYVSWNGGCTRKDPISWLRKAS